MTEKTETMNTATVLKINYTDNDVDLLARLMRAEALGEGEYGMLLVGNVVVNRVICASPDFDEANTIQQVVYQTPGGFAGVKSDLFKAKATTEERALAIRVLSGEKLWPASNALWFYAPQEKAPCRSTWFDQENAGRYKGHCFYIPDPTTCVP